MTGGEFLGRHIVDAARAPGVPSEHFRRASPDFDLTDAAAVDRLFRAFPTGVDVVIHAAGYVGGISANIREPAKFFHDNMAWQPPDRGNRSAGLAARSGGFVLVGTAS